MASSDFASADDLRKWTGELSDAAKSYDPAAGLAGTDTRLQMISRAEDIIRGLTDPSFTGHVYVSRSMELVAIRTLMYLKVLEHIPATGSISLADLSMATNAQESLLERLLRMTVCTGFLNQLENKQYSHTKFSYAFVPMPGPGAYFQMVYDEGFLMVDNLHVYLQEKGLKEPMDQRYSPYAWKSKQEGKVIWDIMAQNPSRFAAFQAGLAHASATVPLTGYYDFNQLKTDDDRPVLVDLGGGVGHSILRIMEAYPDLPAGKFVLQEMKAIIEESKRQKTLPDEVVVMEHDFFTPQPIKGAKAYMFRRVMHDYSDPVCIDMLKQIVPAMSPDSVILLADFCFPSRASPADLPIAAMDVGIFNMGGKERSEDGFRTILEAAGLEYVATHRSEGGFGAIVEGRLSGKGQ